MQAAIVEKGGVGSAKGSRRLEFVRFENVVGVDVEATVKRWS